MEGRLLAIAKRFWPELDTMSGRERADAVAEVIGVLYSAPLALAAIVWLATATDPALIRTEWLALLLLCTLLFAFDRFGFFYFVELTPGTYMGWGESLWSVVAWSAALIFGPTGLWVFVLWKSAGCARDWRSSSSADSQWQLVRNLMFNLVRVVLAGLVALALCKHWLAGTPAGGAFVLPGLTPGRILPTFCAMLVWWLLSLPIWVPYLAQLSDGRTLTGPSLRRYIRFCAFGVGWHILAVPFAVLATGLYKQNGLGAYLLLVAGVLLTSLLAHRMSHAAERSQLRSRELEKLERLGRAILDAPPDASALPNVLREHVSDMFPRSRLEIRIGWDRLSVDEIVLRHPYDCPSASTLAWEWLRTASEARCFLPGQGLPWGDPLDSSAVGADLAGVVVAPIVDVETTEPVGGIYLSRGWRAEGIVSLLPAVQSLAAQIGSALYSAKAYAQALAHQRVEHELALAWQIQESFLPADLPDVPGWQLTATLEPARETSGDFYDVIRLPNGRLGILVADVADKGMPAALYMALSRTLIRTYAAEWWTQPELALTASNRRILTDTHASMFVTAFYGILDPASGTLTYCNAGHNPPYLLSAEDDHAVQALRRTGMALGVTGDARWEQKTVQMAHGDVLLLYTDGVTEAQNAQGVFFGEGRLLEVVQATLAISTLEDPSAQRLSDELMAEVRGFAADGARSDDLTLMIVIRGPEEHPAGPRID
jgi:serine phosphatase RsbU (regulator of sigma subunit)